MGRSYIGKIMCVCMKCKSTDIFLGKEPSKNGNIIEYSICNNCNREFISKKQIFANEQNIKNSLCR
jgi:hypothetical protein